jgi:hypothetical protein
MAKKNAIQVYWTSLPLASNCMEGGILGVGLRIRSTPGLTSAKLKT